MTDLSRVHIKRNYSCNNSELKTLFIHIYIRRENLLTFCCSYNFYSEIGIQNWMQINGQSKYTSCGNCYIFQWQKVYKSNISLEWNCRSCQQDWRASSERFARLHVTRPNINFLSNATSVPYLHLLDEQHGYWWAFYVTSTSIHQAKYARPSRKSGSEFLLLFFPLSLRYGRLALTNIVDRRASFFCVENTSARPTTTFLRLFGIEWHFQIKISMNASLLSWDKSIP